MADGDTKSGKSFLRVIVVIALLVVVGGGTIWLKKFRSPKIATNVIRSTYTVQRQDLTISVTESGEIQARESTDYLCEVERGAAITSIVPEGTVITKKDVEAGKILVQLDSSELEENFTQQKITFAKAEADYTEAQEAYEIQLKQNESDINAAMLKVKFAFMDLQKYLSENLAQKLLERAGEINASDDKIITSLIENLVKDPNDPRWGGGALQSKRNYESAIKLANQELEKNKNQLRGTEKLFAKQYVALSELERDRLAQNRSEIELQSAITDLELFLQYDFPKQVEKLFSDYRESKLQLQRTEAQTRSQEAQAQAKLNSAEATFKLQKDRLDKWEKQLKACTIRATSIGMVVYGSSSDFYSRMRNPIEVGNDVREGQKIITVPNTAEMSALVKVHESWVERVQPDLPVHVTVDAFPDTTYSGKVLSVAPLPDPQSRWMNTGLKVYTTEVSIDDLNKTIRPGMSAKVEIIVASLKNVLCVPVQAVAHNKGGKVCYVVNGNEMKARPVQTGNFNDSYIEIVSGLTEGEEISLIPPRLNGQEGNSGSQQRVNNHSSTKQKPAAKPQSSEGPEKEKQKRPSGGPGADKSGGPGTHRPDGRSRPPGSDNPKARNQQ